MSIFKLITKSEIKHDLNKTNVKQLKLKCPVVNIPIRSEKENETQFHFRIGPKDVEELSSIGNKIENDLMYLGKIDGVFVRLAWYEGPKEGY